MLSIVIPVFNEADNLSILLQRLFSAELPEPYEVIVVDDSVDSLTVDSILPFKDKFPLKIIHRGMRLGLASAVVEGFKQAQGEILICIDGDGSHPPEKIGEMVNELKKNGRMVLGSRHIPGGEISPDWSLFRYCASKICTAMVYFLSRVKDPMSGFFAIKRGTFLEILPKIKPISYKIALEIIVKGSLTDVIEIPFKFSERQKGSSKVNFKVVLGMFYHFILLYKWKIFKRNS